MADSGGQSPRINLTPPVVPGFNLSEKLGQGTYATVYKALSCTPSGNGIRETFAVKCIARSKINSHKTSVDNLVAEIQILKRLSHRHIVQLVDFRWDSNYIYMIMEYCGGGDLSLFIRQQRTLPQLVARKFLRQLASAMQYLRDENIAHMDLKPQNILLSSTKSPIILKLADFGFAQHMTSHGDVGTSFRGSLLYMAPEMITRGHYDARVDLWSIGVILYECVFGEAPFACKGIPELMSHICANTPIIIPQCTSEDHPLSQDCISLLQGLLQRDPNHRFNFKEFFHHPFVDIDHIPSKFSLERGNAFIEEAVLADRTGKYGLAVKLYVEALDYLVPALQYELSVIGRERIQVKINQYLRRAEELKQSMKPEPPPRRNKHRDTASASLQRAETPGQCAPSFDVTLWSDKPQVSAALTVVSAAEDMESKEKWEEALAKYQLAIESMLNLLGTEKAETSRRISLRDSVEKWLQKAEAIRNYIQVRDLSLTVIARDHEAVEVEEQAEEALSISSNAHPRAQCILQ